MNKASQYKAKAHRSKPRHTLNCLSISSGYSLIEIVVTIAMIGIVLGLAVPNFTNTISRNQLTNSVNDLVVALGSTRQVALARGLTTFICHSASSDNSSPTCGGTGSGWDQGVLIYASAAGRFNPSLRDYVSTGGSPDSLVQQQKFSAAKKIEVTQTNAASHIAFTPDGLLFGGVAVVLKVCDASRTGEAGKLVKISPAGRISSEDAEGSDTCT